MRRFLAALSASLVLTFNAFAQAPTVSWQPEFRFPGTFFPAFAIASSGLDTSGPTDKPSAFGYKESSSLGVTVTDAPEGARIKVRIELPEIGAVGEIEAPPFIPGQNKGIYPRMHWNQAQLASISQPLPGEVIFKVFVDGVAAGEERRPIRVRAVNDAPLRSCHSENRCTDYSVFLSAFVNENHPQIDSLLRATLNIPTLPVKRWIGVQGSQQDVMMQVWAIWYHLQRSRVTYSSITTGSEVRPDVMSQTIRPFSQSLDTQQANCIDGTALFASVLRRIGIEPVIVLVPGHAFLGFATNAEQTAYSFLETTMLNTPLNPFHLKPPTKEGMNLATLLGADIHMTKSQQSFNAAIASGEQRFREAEKNIIGRKPGYAAIRILKAREAGIMPLPL